MENQFRLDVGGSALLLIDLQEFLVENHVPKEVAPQLLERTGGLLAAARDLGMLVLHVKVAFRPGHPEISPRNKVFAGLRGTKLFTAEDPGAGIHPAVAPLDSEAVIVKHRVGSFTGTDLQTVLRSNEINTIILAGIATSGAILSTVRHAFDLDYSIVVASDCCADLDRDLHDAILGKIFPQQTEVLPADRIIAALRGEA
ncbi:MAG: cysteine hydrolase [Phenylobacterium sp.]|nr:MAG: cysteine hydrolase [Phenylobacterium sp.]